MRIGIISDFFPMYGAKSIEKLVQSLEKERHSAVILTSNYLQDKSSYPSGVSRFGKRSVIIRFPSRFVLLSASPLSFPISLPFQANRYFQKFNVDIVHLHFLASQSFQAYALLSLVRKNFPIVGTSHGIVAGYNSPLLQLIAAAIRTISRISLKSIDCFSVVTKLTIPFLRSLGVDQKKIHYVPNGVDASIFKTRNRKESENKLDLENSVRKRVLFLAHLRKSKGVDVFIAAANKIIKRRDDVEFLIVGSGPLEEKVKHFVQNSNGYIQHRSYIEDNLLPYAYNTADIYVLPSFVEGLPQSLIEAMACGVASIATDVGGVSELFPNPTNRFLIKPSDIDDLVSNIELLLDNDVLRNETGKIQGNHVKKCYSQERITQLYLQLYTSVIEERSQ